MLLQQVMDYEWALMDEEEVGLLYSCRCTKVLEYQLKSHK